MTHRKLLMRRYRMAKLSDGARVWVVRFMGVDGHEVRFTSACSGCSPCDEGPGPDRGMGCRECGYTGKRRHAEWVPLTDADFAKVERVMARRWARKERQPAEVRA